METCVKLVRERKQQVDAEAYCNADFGATLAIPQVLPDAWIMHSLIEEMELGHGAASNDYRNVTNARYWLGFNRWEDNVDNPFDVFRATSPNIGKHDSKTSFSLSEIRKFRKLKKRKFEKLIFVCLQLARAIRATLLRV